ncbi:MAG TPA: S8 family serine peptidase, partial [Luteolibacter sp.]|nr:S8 family serine peptidase [Luteolibacter sp.]
MRTNPYSVAATILLACTTLVSAQEEIADVLADPALSLSRPADRERIAARITEIENRRLASARAKGRAMGLPLRFKKPGGGTQELIDFKGEEPVYLTTLNTNAAISTGANLLSTSPYSLNGAGLTVGVWDAAGGRPTHQEFSAGSRLVNKNGPATDEHAMHVAGTIAASGFNSAARGMANAARIDSYDWNNDLGEMTLAAATAPGQTTKIQLSNHSYNIVSGWEGGTWWGNGTDAAGVEHDFGRYSSNTRGVDALAYDAPYYLPFWAAGNDRSDNPSFGDSVRLSPSSSSTVSYNPSLHPKGDGVYRNGFETISFYGLAKNIVTIGAANDAVTGGSRDIAKATLTSFSSTGPCDDGRIKPDLVANGASVTSCVDWSNSAYTSMSGTSMASPNACGSAALLVQHYGRLFPGGAMRSSTLKGLLIHTADDLGNPGPDYKTGWGLVDVKEAADLLTDHHAFPAKRRLIESEVTSVITTRTFEFDWDGFSAIRATLCWTDPEGPAVSTHDSRAANLVNNLNLKLIAPNGASYYPFVMPFVGTWTTASMDLPATTGVNNTDNVEQVLVKTPGQTGKWRAEVSYSGLLTDSRQQFGLLISGSKDTFVVDIFPPSPNPMTWVEPPAAGGLPVPGPLAATDFTGRTVNGATASNIVWQTDGLADPGDLTTDAPAGLFDGTLNAQNHFAPNRNLDTEGPWSVSVPLNLTESFVTLTEVVLGYRHFTDEGNFQPGTRKVIWNVTVSGSASGEIASVEIIDPAKTFWTTTAAFDPPLLLEAGESYTLTITATGNNSAVYPTNTG